MNCPQCQHANAPDSAFCDECGARLEAPCPACREPNRGGAKFCRKCGQALSGGATAPATGTKFLSPESYTPKHLAERILTSKAALEGERKQVTVLFADLKGSMELEDQARLPHAGLTHHGGQLTAALSRLFEHAAELFHLRVAADETRKTPSNARLEAGP